MTGKAFEISTKVTEKMYLTYKFMSSSAALIAAAILSFTAVGIAAEENAAGLKNPYKGPWQWEQY